jgi:hypothetical protein
MSKLSGVIDAEQMIESLGNNTVFIIERSMDEEVVVYQALIDDKKEMTGMNMFWTKGGNWAEREPVGEKAKALFYGIQKERIKRGHFRILLNCFQTDPENPRFIDIHIKKSGAVVAKGKINNKLCTLQKVVVDYQMFPPKMNAMSVCGTFKGEKVVESIPINQDLVSQIDLSGILF